MTYREKLKPFPVEAEKMIRGIMKGKSLNQISRDPESLNKLKECVDSWYEQTREYATFAPIGNKDPSIEKICQKNYKKWSEMIDLDNSINGILELVELPEGTTLIIQEKKMTSNYNGLHGQYKAYYVKDSRLENIFIPLLGSFNTKTRNYHKHGGNYSFTHDLTCEFSLLVSDDYEYFKYRKI